MNTPDEALPRFATVDDLSDRTGLSAIRIRKLARRKGVPVAGVTMGGDPLYEADAAAELMKRRRVQT